MHLITVAHHGEALGVIEKFGLKNLGTNLFGNEEMVLLLTGEGPFESAIKTASLIPRYAFQKIINLGIAGSLSSDLKIGDVVKIRTLYLVNDLKPEFRTFQSSADGVDCLTSFERILDPNKAQVLKGLGKVVDREAWGVAYAAKNAGIPFVSYKVISDQAGSMDACELVKEKAQEFAQILAQTLGEILNITSSSKEELPALPGFHFTFTTAHRFKNLLNKISIKEDISQNEAQNSLSLEELRGKDILPKERTRLLLDLMEERIDPTRKVLFQTALELTKEFHEKGLKLVIDQNWENPFVTISLEASDDVGLKNKIQSLSTLSLNKFSSLMKGDFHVE